MNNAQSAPQFKADINEVKDRLPIPAAWARLGLNGSAGVSCPSPFRPDKNPSFSVYDNGRKWKDHSTGEGGDVIDFICRALGVEKKEGIQRAADLAGICRPAQAGSPSRLRRPAQTEQPKGIPFREMIQRHERDKEHRLEEKRKAELRSRWCLDKFNTREGKVLADKRHLPYEAVDMGDSLGFLMGTNLDGHRCYVIREGAHFAQARRLDGGMLTLKSGKEVDRKNLPGSLSSGFIGWKLLCNPLSPVLVVEGCGTFFEGLAAILSVDADIRAGGGWVVLAAVSAGSSLAQETASIPDLKGRRIRLLPDSDHGPGYKAGGRWQAEFTARGAIVDGFAHPHGCKDLGDVMAAVKKDPAAYSAYRTSLFTL